MKVLTKLLVLLLVTTMLASCGKDEDTPVVPVTTTNSNNNNNNNGGTVTGSLEQKLNSVKSLMEARTISQGMTTNHQYIYSTGTYGVVGVIADDSERRTIESSNSYKLETKTGIFDFTWDDEGTITYTSNDRDEMMARIFTTDEDRELYSVTNYKVVVNGSNFDAYEITYRVNVGTEVFAIWKLHKYVVAPTLPLAMNPIAVSEGQEGGEYRVLNSRNNYPVSIIKK